jgi:hypothetical protein
LLDDIFDQSSIEIAAMHRNGSMLARAGMVQGEMAATLVLPNEPPSQERFEDLL